MNDAANPISALDARAQVSAAFRWISMLLVSLTVLATYLVYDSISPLGEIIQRDMNVTPTDFGLLYGAYSYPNFIMPFLGGILLDRIGVRLGGMTFAGLCAAGALLTALGSEGSFWVMFAGRLLFGLGAETLIVAQNKIIAKWFKGRELALAFSVNLSICRLGTMLSYNLVPSLKESLQSWTGALWVVAVMMGVGFGIFVLYALMDRWAERRIHVVEEKPERIELRLLFGMPRTFWYITLLCVTFYSAVFPFQQFAPQIFGARFGMDDAYASWITGLIIIITIFGTPVFGWLCDRVGKRATMMLIGSLLIVPIHLAIGFLAGGSEHPAAPIFDLGFFKWYAAFPLNGLDVIPILPIMLLGLVFSLVPAAMWPSVARIVEEKRLGTAYGLMGAIQNVGLGLVPVLIGQSKHPQFVQGTLEPFQLSMLLVAGLGLCGFVFAILLKRADARAGSRIELPERKA